MISIAKNRCPYMLSSSPTGFFLALPDIPSTSTLTKHKHAAKVDHVKCICNIQRKVTNVHSSSYFDAIGKFTHTLLKYTIFSSPVPIVKSGYLIGIHFIL